MLKRTVIVVATGFVMMAAAAGNILAAPVASFTHIDDNPYSPRSGQNVGPYDAPNTGHITMWYFQYNKY